MNSKKYVLITGVSSGIGYETTRYLIQKGFHVIGTVRKESDKAKLMEDFPGNFSARILDVTNDEQIDQLADSLKLELAKEGLFGLINNAGIAKGGPMMLMDKKEFQLQMDTNLNSVFSLSNALLPLLGAAKDSKYPAGRIVNISSISGLVNTPFLGPYCVSKHALESLSDIYRRELAMYGIKVILIEPGPIKTPIWEKSVPKSNPYVHTDFEKAYDAFVLEVDKSAAGALPVKKVAEKIFESLTKRSPANRYMIAKNRTAIKLVSSILPSKWLDNIFLKQTKKHMD